jgi:hypothetical protein
MPVFPYFAEVIQGTIYWKMFPTPPPTEGEMKKGENIYDKKRKNRRLKRKGMLKGKINAKLDK